MNAALEIKRALETRLAAMPNVLPTQTENAVFEVPSGPYQRVDFMRAPPDNPTFGTGFYRELGTMQVMLLYPTAGGGLDAYTMAGAIRDWFPRGSSYDSNGVTTMIGRTTEIGIGRTEADGRFTLPVRIRYFANIQG